MSKLRCSITVSLDGYVAGPNQSLDNPLGEGASHLHDWAFRTKTFLEMHGEPGEGETGVNDDVLREGTENVGATLMGRNMFGPVRGPWGQDPWKGWWGDTPPFHHSVFVLTHYPRDPLVMKGGTTFHFVTQGIESALTQARKAAGKKDVTIGGGASVIRQYIAAGLLDEIEIHVVPLLFGAGERLFEPLDAPAPKLEVVRTKEGPGVSHLKYRVVK